MPDTIKEKVLMEQLESKRNEIERLKKENAALLKSALNQANLNKELEDKLREAVNKHEKNKKNLRS